MKRLVLTVAILIGLAAPVWGQSDAGYEAYKRGDYATAHRIWKPLAEQGHASAQYNLALLYHHGLGVKRQLAEAAKWYGRAAENGDADAQKAIGDLYVEGFWGKKDYAKAAQWYRLAAKQGHADAQRKLGVLFAQGRGVDRNSDAAIKWLRKAVEQGDAEAQKWLRKLQAKRQSRPRQAAGHEGAKVEGRPGVLQGEKRAAARDIGERIKPTIGPKCPRSPDTPYEVNVRIDIAPARINHDAPRTAALGQTWLPLEIKTSAEIIAVPFGDQFCFWVRRIPVTLRYRYVEIFVTKKYSTRSCQYRVILDHEKDHVRAARRNLIRYAARVKAALTSLLIPTGRDPVVVASLGQAKREVEALALKLLKPVYQSMLVDLRKAQAAIDSPEEYRRTFRRCRNW